MRGAVRVGAGVVLLAVLGALVGLALTLPIRVLLVVVGAGLAVAAVTGVLLLSAGDHAEPDDVNEA